MLLVAFGLATCVGCGGEPAGGGDSLSDVVLTKPDLPDIPATEDTGRSDGAGDLLADALGADGSDGAGGGDISPLTDAAGPDGDLCDTCPPAGDGLSSEDVAPLEDGAGGDDGGGHADADGLTDAEEGSDAEEGGDVEEGGDAADGGGTTNQPVCGDGACEQPESCSTCPDDCGACPPPLDPPGGRTNFVVALGKLHSGEKNNDWVRVGSYLFDPDTHVVTATMWKWTQASPTHREHSGVQPNSTCAGGEGGVRKCEILTPAGFKDAPNDERTGTYAIQFDGESGKPYVRIDWTPDRYEEWWLPTEGAETYAVLQLKESDKATAAFAYGSDAPLSARQEYPAVVQVTGQTFEKWIRKRACSTCAYAAVSSASNPSNHFHTWTVCGDGLSGVMTRYDPESSGDCEGSPDSSIQFYMFRPATDRRDSWWFWHTCKTEGSGWNECYGCDYTDSHGGSRTYALVQVLDDAGNYVGHVGVEAAFDEGTCGDPTEYRYADVLGVVRLTPEEGFLNNPAEMP